MEALYGVKLFATLDLYNGYLQVLLKKDAAAKTAFITPNETGEFTRCMFSLMNAIFYLSKMMERVLGQCRNKIFIFYLDDILIFAKGWDDLMKKLNVIVIALEKAGLTLNLTKCVFGVDLVEYLGFILTTEGIEPGERKVRAIKEFPTPTNATEIRRFIGLASFFRRFVKGFAEIAAPLTRLTKADVKFEWLAAQINAFDTIKEKLTSRPVLALYNANASVTELHTDASKVGLGAILCQSDKEGKMRLVYAISRKTSEPEQNYHSSKLELLAIVWAVQRLRQFLLPIRFEVITDCEALTHINISKTTNSQLIRWHMTLVEYDHRIVYRPGNKMEHVDALSRAPVDETAGSAANVDSEVVFVIATREEEIILYQSGDEKLNRKIEILNKPEKDRTKYEKGEIKDYVLENGLLCKSVKEGNRVRKLFVVPDKLRKALVIRYHDLKNHFGVEKTLESLRRHYYFHNAKNYVKNHIKRCLECIIYKSKHGKQPGLLHPIPPGKRPFEIIHMDHVGPFVTSKRNNKYLFNIVDNFTKFTVSYAVKDTTTKSVLFCLRKFLRDKGYPNRIVCDRGTAFTANDFQDFCKERHIRVTYTASRHPQANGLVERVNGIILNALRTSEIDSPNREWDMRLPELVREMNLSVNKTTGKAPYEALMGYLPRFETDVVRATLDEPYETPAKIRAEMTENISKAQKGYKERYDKGRLANVSYDVGDIVYVETYVKATGESTKLRCKRAGPYVVVKLLPGDVYQLQKLTNVRKETVPFTSHVSQMHIWRNTSDPGDSDDEELDENETESDNENNSEQESSDKQSPEVAKARIPRMSLRNRKQPVRLLY